MLGLMKSLTYLSKDLVQITVAPVEIVVDSARIITKPIAETSKEIVSEIKKESK